MSLVLPVYGYMENKEMNEWTHVTPTCIINYIQLAVTLGYEQLPDWKPFHYQLMHTMLKNTESLKHSKITLQHVSVYAETIFRELQSVLG